MGSCITLETTIFVTFVETRFGEREPYFYPQHVMNLKSDANRDASKSPSSKFRFLASVFLHETEKNLLIAFMGLKIPEGDNVK